MRETRVTLPELALIAGTRVALGAGLGFLLADRFPEGQSKAIGWTLLLIGGLSTIPLAFEVLGGGRSFESWEGSGSGTSDPRFESSGRQDWRKAPLPS